MKSSFLVFETLHNLSLPISSYVSVNATTSVNTTAPENVLDNSEAYYHSLAGDSNNHVYIQFNFLKHVVDVRAIQITLVYNQDPQNWKIEGSSDGINFETIYENYNKTFCHEYRINEAGQCHCAYHATQRFDMNVPGIYISIKMTTTGLASCNLSEYIIIKSFEIIGTIHNLYHTCKNTYTNRFLPFFTLILLITSHKY